MHVQFRPSSLRSAFRFLRNLARTVMPSRHWPYRILASLFRAVYVFMVIYE